MTRTKDIWISLPAKLVKQIRDALDANVNRRRYEEHEWGQMMQESQQGMAKLVKALKALDEEMRR